MARGRCLGRLEACRARFHARSVCGYVRGRRRQGTQLLAGLGQLRLEDLGAALPERRGHAFGLCPAGISVEGGRPAPMRVASLVSEALLGRRLHQRGRLDAEGFGELADSVEAPPATGLWPYSIIMVVKLGDTAQ
jgi:hypothetical protein